MFRRSPGMISAVALAGLLSAVLGLGHLRTADSDPLALAQSISKAYQLL